MCQYRRAVNFKSDANQAAAKKANEAIAKKTGGRKLDWSKNDATLRKEWMDAYIAAGGEYEVVKPSGRKPGKSAVDCVSTVTVTIMDGNGIDAPCRYIPKDKTRKFKGIGDPAGGSYVWTVSGGHASIAAGAHSQIVEVRGVSTSAAINDCALTVKYTGAGGTATATTPLTVFEFTQIKATIKPTPAKTARAGIPAPADHTFTSNSKSVEFAVNEPLVLMRNSRSAADIKLEVTCVPAGLPIGWHRGRNSHDHASLGGPGDLPTLSPGGAAHEAQLGTNQKGSFRIRAFLECRGANDYHEGVEFIPLHLVLADATIVSDNSVAQPVNLQARDDGDRVTISNGAWTGLNDAGMKMELIADVTGGGATGRLGLDRVFAGLINNLANVDIRSTYRDSSVAPPVGHDFNWVYADNVNAATGNWGRHVFRPADPAPNPYTWPLLDSGRDDAGTGGNTATMRSSKVARANRPVGQRWTIQCMDSPGRSFPYNHTVVPAARLRTISYNQHFTANFCFWTNHAKNEAATGDTADRLYTVILTVPWEVVGEWTVTFPAGAAVLAETTPHNIQTTVRTQHNPIVDVESQNIEVRPPSGIRQNPVTNVDVGAWNGRT